MVRIRNLCLLLVPLLLLLLMPGAAASPLEAPQRLPASEWWLVVHSQCDNTLHWINPSGEFAAIPRPTLPDEAPVAACGYRAMHISQDGRYLVQTGALTNGNNAVGFYDLQTGEWLRVFEAVGEAAHLGSRYSSDANNHIAVSFSTTPAGAPGWRVILFDMATGDELYEMRSDGSEIAGFVGGEFLATTPTVPTALLLGEDAATTNDVVVLRFDGVAAGASPLGAVAWYPLGAPGIGQPLVSSPYTLADMDIAATRRAVRRELPAGDMEMWCSDPTAPTTAIACTNTSTTNTTQGNLWIIWQEPSTNSLLGASSDDCPPDVTSTYTGYPTLPTPARCLYVRFKIE